MLQQLTVSIEDSTISAEKIPDHTWDIACSRMESALMRIMADPKNRAKYEAWKAEYLEKRSKQA